MIGRYVGVYDQNKLLDPTVTWVSKIVFDACTAGKSIALHNLGSPTRYIDYAILRVIEHPVGFENRDDVKFLVWHERHHSFR